MTAYPHLSEQAARTFARRALVLRESAHRINIESMPRNRRLAERYRRASDYLRSRVVR